MFSQGAFSNSYAPFDEVMSNMHYGFSPVSHMNNTIFDNVPNPLNGYVNTDSNIKILNDGINTGDMSHSNIDDISFINSAEEISSQYAQPYANFNNNNWIVQDNVGANTIFASTKQRSSFSIADEEADHLNEVYDNASHPVSSDVIFPSVTACTPPPNAPSVLSMSSQNQLTSSSMSVANSINSLNSSSYNNVMASKHNENHFSPIRHSHNQITSTNDVYYRRDSIESVFESGFNSLQQNISHTINQNQSDDLMYFYNNNLDSKQLESVNLKFENDILESERSLEAGEYDDDEEDATTFITEELMQPKAELESKLLADDSDDDEEDEPAKQYFLGRYPVVRGITAGGSTTRPPNVESSGKEDNKEDSGLKFVKAKLSIRNGEVSNIGGDSWSEAELKDKRRIIRIERRQRGPEIEVSFHIIGSAEENVDPIPSDDPNVDVVEISCLECLSYKRIFDEDMSMSNLLKSRKRGSSFIEDERDNELMDEDEGSQSDSTSIDSPSSSSSLENYRLSKEYYITSVEVIKIVELLISTEGLDPADCRRERGRIRSNLVPFWSKKSIKSKKTGSSSTSSSSMSMSSPTPSTPFSDGARSNSEFRDQLAQRIMGYKIRKPRGFDKEVRILKWENLVPALERALQSYYVQLPSDPKDW